MPYRYLNLIVIAFVAACSEQASVVEDETISFGVDVERLSVSGISSGAYMAGQLHVAHSEVFNGAGLIAGGPYWCAEGSLNKGLGPCMKGGDVGSDRLWAYAEDSAAAGRIDSLENLSDDRVWIFHGTGDVIMNPETSAATVSFYKEVVRDEHVMFVNDVEVLHGFPTLASGAACDEFAVPYLNACDYDAAGELLTAIYGTMEQRTTASGELLSIPQPGAGAAEMLDTAFLYVPESCAAGANCGVHVALHGCLQSSEFVDAVFATDAGYNEWAEANHLLVLYPQVASSKIAPLNPNGCWDWWGYTDEHYATQQGKQIAVIKATLDSLAGTTL